MPVVMDKGAAGRNFSLVPGVRCVSLRPAAQREVIDIGIVNMMPDAALEATERQFIGLLAAAAEKKTVRIKLITLPDLVRGASAHQYVSRNYATIDELRGARLDGLIVTGAEPRRKDLRDEPYWAALAKLVAWAQQNTLSSIWSCLAAHAAVLQLDGIERSACPDKCFGLFACDKVADHPLTVAMPARFQVPHSRWNEVPEPALAACGYQVLSRAPDAGVDLFIRSRGSLFVFMQGHPEYDATTLGREYRRDVGRYLRGERSTFPSVPQNYFDHATVAALDAFRERATSGGGGDVLESYPATAVQTALANASRAAAVQIYRNWLSFIAARRQSHRPAPIAETASSQR